MGFTFKDNKQAGVFSERPAPAPRTLDDRAHELMRADHWLGGNAAKAQAEAEQQEE